MATIYGYKNFNNYYNRIVKGQDIKNINDFTSTYGDYDYCQTSTVDNFNESDGVFTTHILGVQNNPYFGNCSYILVCKDNINIDSKWFIVDQNFKCYGQYQLSLYRDVITENWNTIVNADAFIERGIVSDNSPFIYNRENITTNQIKKQEVVLKDPFNCAWIVGYVSKNYDPTGTISFTGDAIEDYTVTNKSDIATWVGATEGTYYKKKVTDEFSVKFSIYVESGLTQKRKWTFTKSQHGSWNYTETMVSTVPSGAWYCTSTTLSASNIINRLDNSTIYSTVVNNTTVVDDATQYNNVYNKNNLIAKVTSTDNYYKVSNQISHDYEESTYSTATVISAINTLLNFVTHSGSVTQYSCNVGFNKIRYTLVEVVEGTYSVIMPGKSSRIKCRECFDMFVIPYPIVENIPFKIKNNKDNSWTDFSISKSLSLTIAQNLATELGTNLFDIQLLPYNPLTNILYGEVNNPPTELYLDINTTNTKRYTLVTKGTTNVGILLWSASNRGTKDIYYEIPVTNKKIQNQTQTVRLSSPNYSSQFDFNVAKNEGVAVFNVDYTYLPIRPYIHIAPVFTEGSLYGNEYNDARGLICSGDFSIGYTSDSWINYQNQNKNYDNIFDRQTQTLEVQHEQQKIQSIAGIITGGIQGAGMGAMIGGPLGVGIGASAGLLSAGAGILDYQMQEKMYNENMSARKDIYEMQLDNIKAQPNTLTKVTAINENNKIFPFLEVYDCTDEEKVAIANYIRSNGMTIGVYGKISNYINTSWSYSGIEDRGFVKASLIKIDGIEDDTHIINAINNELNKGVYTK